MKFAAENVRQSKIIFIKSLTLCMECLKFSGLELIYINEYGYVK